MKVEASGSANRCMNDLFAALSQEPLKAIKQIIMLLLTTQECIYQEPLLTLCEVFSNGYLKYIVYLNLKLDRSDIGTKMNIDIHFCCSGNVRLGL